MLNKYTVYTFSSHHFFPTSSTIFQFFTHKHTFIILTNLQSTSYMQNLQGENKNLGCLRSGSTKVTNFLVIQIDAKVTTNVDDTQLKRQDGARNWVQEN